MRVFTSPSRAVKEDDTYTMGQIRGARGSRPFKLVNEIMSLTKVGIYALGVTKIH